MRVGERIRALRNERGLSLGRLAEACGIYKGNLSSIERGKMVITIETLVRIARGLGVTAAELLTFPAENPLEAEHAGDVTIP